MSLITSIREIEAIYPTSRWDRVSTLAAPLQQVEHTRLQRILGRTLLSRIIEDYRELVSRYGGILPEQIESEESIAESEADTGKSGLTVDIIRACQSYELFAMLSNNIRILSTSLNSGGGFNRMSATDYEPADDKRLDSLGKEMWHRAMDALESLLLLLEEDAHTGQCYTTLWKDSEYYYLHHDLLIRSADDMQHYLDIDGSRERFASLVPDLRSCQDTYITARIGPVLMDRLLSMGEPEQESDAEEEEETETVHPEVITQSDIDAAIARVDSSQTSRQYYSQLSHHLKSALAGYTAERRREYEQTSAHDSADRQASLAMNIIVRHPSDFLSYIRDCENLQFEYEHITHGTWSDYLVSYARDTLHMQVTETVPEDTVRKEEPRQLHRHSSILDLGGWHLT